jgi:hypothetical protein
MPMYRGQPCSYQRPYAKPYPPYLNGPIGITNLQRIVICHLGGTQRGAMLFDAMCRANQARRYHRFEDVGIKAICGAYRTVISVHEHGLITPDRATSHI